MKNKLITAIIFALIFTFSACKEITVTTKVHEDGSFTRLVKISGDSSDVFKAIPPYPIDESWKVSYRKDTTGEVKHILIYSKTYANDEALNEDIKNDTSSYKNIPRHVEIDKRFGFFYSYLTFRETFKHTNPFSSSKDYSYLTKRETELLTGTSLPVSKSDSVLFDGLEEKTTDHLIYMIRDELLKVMDSGIRLLDNPRLNAIDLHAYQDSVDRTLDNGDVEDLGLFIDLYAEWTGVEDFSQLKELEPPLFMELTQSWKDVLYIAFLDGYSQVVEMPGLLTSSNSTTILGNKASWEVESYRVLFSDYELHAESRVVNYWAFILSGAVLLLLVLILVFKAFRR